MKILVLTTRLTYKAGWLQEVRDLTMGGPHELTVLAVHLPRTPRGGVRRFVVVDPSVVPFRPVADFPVRGRPLPRHWTRHVVRAQRLLRRGWVRLFGAPSPRRSATYLAVACRTSRAPAQLAAAADLVVALEEDALLAMWHLARRVPDTAYATSVLQARQALTSRFGEAETERAQTVSPDTTDATAARMPEPAPAAVRLLVAPLNPQGQGHAWASGVEAAIPDVAARCFSLGGPANPGRSDLLIDDLTFATDLQWRRYWRRHVLETYTHVLAESGLPVLGGTVAGIDDQLRQLARAGVSVARVAHGDDARIPSIDMASNPWSAYARLAPLVLRAREGLVQQNLRSFSTHEGPVFVSMPGSVEFLPDATWLPLVVDTEHWASERPIPAQRRLVVAHAPVPQDPAPLEELLNELAGTGAIDYRQIRKRSRDARREAFAEADVVVGRFHVADYDLEACEAMSLGRVVVGNVAPAARQRVAGSTGLDLPIVQADPDSLTSVLVELARERERVAELALAAQRFAAAVHSGSFSASVLRPWLLDSASR